MKNLILVIFLNITFISNALAADEISYDDFEHETEQKIATRNNTINQMVKYCGAMNMQNIGYANCLGNVSEFIQVDLDKRVTEIAFNLRTESLKISKDFERNHKLWLNYADKECDTQADRLEGGSGTATASIRCKISTMQNYLNILDEY